MGWQKPHPKHPPRGLSPLVSYLGAREIVQIRLQGANLEVEANLRPRDEGGSQVDGGKIWTGMACSILH